MHDDIEDLIFNAGGKPDPMRKPLGISAEDWEKFNAAIAKDIAEFTANGGLTEALRSAPDSEKS